MLLWLWLLSCLVLALAQVNLSEVPSGLEVLEYNPRKVYNGYLLTCPEDEDGVHGPRIYHPSGALFWGGPNWKNRCMNLQIQRYKDRNVLTFWYSVSGNEYAYGVILDQDYHDIGHVDPPGGPTAPSPVLTTRLAEFLIPGPDYTTAIMFTMRHYRDTMGALGRLGGNPHGYIYDPLMQEVDIASGRVVYRWSAAEHLSLEDSYNDAAQTKGTWQWNTWDFSHGNSVMKDEAGDYVLSYRFLHQIVKVNGKTGNVIWKLGGKSSDFAFNNGSTFIGQHDPRWVEGTDQTEMTIFDNDSDGVRSVPRWGTARGIHVRLDYAAMTVTLLREFLPRVRQPADIEGSMRILPNGNVLVCYGSTGYITEYTAEGEIVFDAYAKHVYRAFKYEQSVWPGEGLPDPDPIPPQAGSSSEGWGSGDTVLGAADETVKVDDGVTMYFSPISCWGFRWALGRC
ncbi:hypothetical protein FISHEDRAFT_73218 [Fistulina hepatica ATCC 64428]|uniref:ASST-domain-containing protein n=1 Tax=Fistulina hepatica ATCC 64428 TaxID=1128425 RepID=A0A0D7ADX9_9AGAR|nr:hypothetical protein FISHEDRAFT_73218 [Fistulina hepatica ATCC 64428]